jgi:hypothetical protein
VTRFTSERDLCVELLTEYITASNEVVDSKDRLHSPKPPSAQQLAASLINHALNRRESARQPRFNPKDQHR